MEDLEKKEKKRERLANSACLDKMPPTPAPAIAAPALPKKKNEKQTIEKKHSGRSMAHAAFGKLVTMTQSDPPSSSLPLDVPRKRTRRGCRGGVKHRRKAHREQRSPAGVKDPDPPLLPMQLEIDGDEYGVLLSMLGSCGAGGKKRGVYEVIGGKEGAGLSSPQMAPVVACKPPSQLPRMSMSSALTTLLFQ